MSKWFVGVPSEERKRKTVEKILSLIGDEEVTWLQLYEKAARLNIGKATLSRHLKNLVKSGLVERRVDTTQYPPRVYYRRGRDLLKTVLIFGEKLEKLFKKPIDLEKYFMLERILRNMFMLSRSLEFYFILSAHNLYVPLFIKLFSNLPKEVDEKLKYGKLEGELIPLDLATAERIINMLEESGVERGKIEEKKIIFKELKERLEEAERIKLKIKDIEKLDEKLEKFDKKMEDLGKRFITPVFMNYQEEVANEFIRALFKRMNDLIEDLEKDLSKLASMKKNLNTNG